MISSLVLGALKGLSIASLLLCVGWLFTGWLKWQDHRKRR
jgi:hypothetical protein